jgi:hypothetical protein
LVEQWIAGTHTALAILTLEEEWLADLLAALVELPPVDPLEGACDFEVGPPLGVPPPEGATAPPAPGEDVAARAGCTTTAQLTYSVNSTALAALDVDRLWSAALATTIPSGSHASDTDPRSPHPSQGDAYGWVGDARR